jgi:hypothetical protein
MPALLMLFVLGLARPAVATTVTTTGTVTVNVGDCPGCLVSLTETTEGCYIVIVPPSGPSFNAHIRLDVAVLDKKHSLQTDCRALLIPEESTCAEFSGELVSVSTNPADSPPFTSYSLEVETWAPVDPSLCL